MAVQGVSGTAVVAVAAGSLFVYSGVKGYKVTSSLRNLLTGKPPASTPVYSLVAATGSSSPGGGTPGSTSSAIANDALKYNGAGYVWGGAPAKGRGNWDCSSFVNWVVGHDLGMAIPGYRPGTYNGAVHGPTTLQWLVFGHGVPRSAIAPGDIIVWPTHMGIAISPTHMISARDPAEGTGIDQIAGDIPGETFTVRSLGGQAQVT